MGKNFLAHVIIEVSADVIQKLGITSTMAEEMFLDQAIDLDQKQTPKEQDNQAVIDDFDQSIESLTDDTIEDTHIEDDASFVITHIYDVLQINQGNRTIYALCVKVIDRKTGEPWWLPYRFLKKAPLHNGEAD